MPKIEKQKAEGQRKMMETGVIQPCNLEEQVLLLIERDILRILIKEYAEKQWEQP